MWPRILICRLSHIGDCVLTLPMVTELRRAFPAAWIAWAIEKPALSLLAGHPAVNEFIPVPRKWLCRMQTVRAMHHELQQRRFELSIDPQSLVKSAALGWLSRSRTRVGFGGRHGRELSPLLNNCRVTPKAAHLVDRSLELIRPLVPDVAFRGFDLPESVESEVRAERLLAEAAIVGPFALINPGAGWASKRWEDNRYAAVARELRALHSITSLVTWAGDQERSSAENIVREAGGSARLAPATSLTDLAALARRSLLFLGGDTGPLHIAAATGTVCIGLHGPTRPADSGAYGTGHIAVQARYQAGTSRQRRTANNDAMREISVSMVIDACEAALQQRRTAQNAA
jgi:ADP-heptose:LPS heptosyltransferase